MTKSLGKHITIEFLIFSQNNIHRDSLLPSAPHCHTAWRVLFILFTLLTVVAPSGACIGAGTILGTELAASCSEPMLLPTGKPTSGAL
jgi:hypothetical protein